MTDVSRFVDKPVKPTLPHAPSRPSWLRRLAAIEGLNFLLTNRIPRHAATIWMGRISGVRNPWLTRAGVWLWTRFTDLNLDEAQETHFRSLHEVFTRRLKPGARPVTTDPAALCSPSDGIVGACGRVEAGLVLQAKGLTYTLQDLLGSNEEALPFLNGHYVTLRLTSAMYHRFHAPEALHLQHVRYISGDTWNVNPVALKRVERLYCRNERAVLRARTSDGIPLLIVPVAAILVASLRLHALDVRLHLRYRGPNELPTDHHYGRGEEMGWFEHGSTIIVLAPPGVELAPGVETGVNVRMGQALLRRA